MAALLGTGPKATMVGRHHARARLDEEQLRDLKSQGMSVRKIAAVMHIGTATVQRHLAVVTT